MDAFQYRNGELWAEHVPLREIAARHGTPTFVYSRAALEAAYREFDAAFATHPHLICYAVKANPNLAILDLYARLGSGFDIVSGGELERVLAAGGDPRKVVFAGVGKTRDEMERALRAGILSFNVESAAELARLDEVAARLGTVAPVSIRVNPDIDPKTHPYITTGLRENKFGVAHTEAMALYRAAASMRNLRINGIDCHIGSQITEAAPYRDALEQVLRLVDALLADGCPIEHVDLGGGLGIRYRDEAPPTIAGYAQAILTQFGQRPQTLILEPGRVLVGNAGLLLTRVEYLKGAPERNFAIVDAAMNDLMRPALYDAYHEMLPVQPRPGPALRYDVVGPVCESGDWLGRDRELALAESDLLAILSAGAYAMSMSSNYNTRPRAAEVMVDGDRMHVVRTRETLEQLYANESKLP
jgi:diaminopimelate decarboxylase